MKTSEKIFYIMSVIITIIAIGMIILVTEYVNCLSIMGGIVMIVLTIALWLCASALNASLYIAQKEKNKD